MEREWYVCPHCGQRILQYINTAHGEGFFIKCKKCKKEIEIKKQK